MVRTHGRTGQKRLRRSHYRYRNENIDRTSEVQAFTSENPRVVRVINHQLDRPSSFPSRVLFHHVTEKCLTSRSVGEWCGLVDRARHSFSRFPSQGNPIAELPPRFTSLLDHPRLLCFRQTSRYALEDSRKKFGNILDRKYVISR